MTMIAFPPQGPMSAAEKAARADHPSNPRRDVDLAASVLIAHARKSGRVGLLLAADILERHFRGGAA